MILNAALKLRVVATMDRMHHKAVETDETVELARRLHDEGLNCSKIADKLDIPYFTVYDWCKYKTRRGREYVR